MPKHFIMMLSPLANTTTTAEAGFKTENTPLIKRLTCTSFRVMSCESANIGIHAFASQHKDHRYYEIVNDTIHPEFDYLYFALRSYRVRLGPSSRSSFSTKTFWPVLVRMSALIDVIRRHWPRFMFMKTMMVGCVAGEAHLDDGNDAARAANATTLGQEAIAKHARALGVRLIVLKEFPD